MKESQIFGVILRRLRKASGFKQEELVGMIDEKLDQGAISRIETGVQMDVGINDLIELLNVFGISFAAYVQMRNAEIKKC